MTVCQYFLRGTCRFGDSCRNEHPGNPRTGFGNQSWTNTNTSSNKNILLFNQDSMKYDFTSEKPLWPLSTYGPAKYEPNLISGLDESMEELRVRAVLALKAGNVNEYTTYETAKIQAADQAYNNARNNLVQAYQTAMNQSPQGKPSNTSAFPSSSSTTAPGPSSAFGKPAFNQPSFGQSGFGSTTGPTQSAFGQPTQAPQSAFSSLQNQNKPATFGQSSFGQPQQQPQFVFGQPSSLIKPASGAFSAFANAGSSPFAAAAAAANQQTGGSSGGGGGFSAFAGQPSAFGAGAGNTASNSGGSVFGTGGTSGFGAPGPVFGQSQPQGQQQTSAFGALQSQPTSVFGQPSQPGQQPQQGGGFSAFGAPSTQPQSAFGNVQAQPTSAFGAPQSQPPSAFGVPSQPQSVFGVPSQPQSAFGGGGGTFGGGGGSTNPLNPLNTGPPSSTFMPLSNSSNPLNAGLPTQPQPPNPFNTPSAFQNNNPFTGNNPFTNALTNINTNTTTNKTTSMNPLANPDTKPNFIAAMSRMKPKPGKTPYDLLLPPGYAGLLPESVVEAFKSQKFEFGKVPDWVPPVEFR